VDKIGFKKLVVWQKAFLLAEKVYLLTNRFPKEEKFGLVQQMRRAAVSIVSNIAEGYGRKSEKEYSQFLSISYGSVCELETQYLLGVRLEYAGVCEDLEALMKEVGAMLYTMGRGVGK